MTQRSIIILAAVLAVLVLIIVGSRFSEQQATPQLGPLVPGLKENLDAVTAVTITGAGGQAVATLARGESGWTVQQRNGFAADFGKLRGALTALAEARRIEQKTANPELYDRLGVEPVENEQATGTMVSIAGLAEPVAIIVGDAAGTDYRYVRLQNEAVSWLIDRDPDIPAETGDWLIPDVLDIDGERIQSVTVTHPDGERVRVSRSDREQSNLQVADIPPDRELLYDSVANVMGDVLEKLQLEDVEPDSVATADPPIRTVFRTFDGLVITANGFDRDDSAWVSFSAAFDAEQAAAFAPPEDAAGEDQQTEVEAGDATETAVVNEAAVLNERLTGWRYKITRFKFDQMTRDMEDLLQAPPAEDS